ncbi:MAG TPA: Rossmann-like and DUF2520 domain-containing protein [Bacteroidota bacterium]
MPAPRPPRVSIVGAGAVGSSLGRALHDRGYPFVSVISRSGAPAIALAKALQCGRASTEIGDLSPKTECLLLTVPDGAIAEVALSVSKLKAINFKKLFVVHCSGVHSADVLEPLRRRGSLVASMHPIQTFPSMRPPGRQRGPGRSRAKIQGIFYGIDGEREAVGRAERLIGDLGGRALIIRKELRPLYHVICVFASNYLMVHLHSIEQLTLRLGVAATWEEMFGPLITATLENAVHPPAADSLTGPIVRGDFETVDLHLKALLAYAPKFLPAYISGGIEVARVGKEQQKLSQENFERLIGQFRQILKNHPLNNRAKVKN